MGESTRKCPKCGAEGMGDLSKLLPYSCSSCGHFWMEPFEAGGMRFERVLAWSPIFIVFKTFSHKHNLFLRTIVLREDAPDLEWSRATVKEQTSKLNELRHHNICPIFEYGDINGQFTFSTPLLDGYPLSSYDINKHGLLSVNKVVDVIQAAALGLAVAHHNEIAHHDVCLENIHVDARGTTRVNEFPVSRFVYFYDQKRMEKVGRVFVSVSPYFVSPEKAESGMEDQRGDVFSLGVVFYYMLTGVYPFDCETETRTIRARIKGGKQKKTVVTGEVFSAEQPVIPGNVEEHRDYLPPVPPKKRRSAIPKSLSDIILAMLSYYPNNRPTVTELINCVNMLRAKTEVLKIKKVQEMIVATETKDIPKMKPISKLKKVGGHK